MSSFSYELDDAGVAFLSIDTPESRENILSGEDMDWMEEFLDRVDTQLHAIESKEEIRAVLLVSAKEGSFISGADVREYLDIPLSDDGRQLSLRAQEISKRIQNSRAPFIAAIRGECSGRGIEIVLACSYRIAADCDDTTFSMPEVKLGLIPSWGGTQRLPRLVGISEALAMILTGDSRDWKSANEIGLVDEIVSEAILIEVAKKRALQIATKELKPKRPWVTSAGELLSEKNPLGRKLIFANARKKIKERTNSTLLAPLMSLEAVEVGMNSSFSRGLHVESVYFGELAVSDASRMLIKNHLDIVHLRKSLPLSMTGNQLETFQKIAVVGAGKTGSEIALSAANRGVRVRLKDKDTASAGEGLKRCYDFFSARLESGEINDLDMEKRMDLISATTDYSGFRRAGLVFEAVDGAPELKRRVIHEIESAAEDTAVIASCTASIRISKIKTGVKHPERIIGMNFFPAVGEADLVEIGVTEDTSERTLATALEFFELLGKVPVVVNDGTGLYTTRVFMAYVNEALHLLRSGAGIDEIDSAIVQFGFTVGPFTALDQMGLQKWAKISRLINEESFGERFKPVSYLNKLTEDGRTGKKSGRGFYKYSRNRQKADSSVYKLLSIEEYTEDLSKEDIQERLSLAMINESCLSLEEGIIKTPRDGDVAATLALGFPAFRGGPFRYTDFVGQENILKRLDRLATRFAPRFTASRLLKGMATNGKKFYYD